MVCLVFIMAMIDKKKWTKNFISIHSLGVDCVWHWLIDSTQKEQNSINKKWFQTEFRIPRFQMRFFSFKVLRKKRFSFFFLLRFNSSFRPIKFKSNEIICMSSKNENENIHTNRPGTCKRREKVQNHECEKKLSTDKFSMQNDYTISSWFK